MHSYTIQGRVYGEDTKNTLGNIKITMIPDDSKYESVDIQANANGFYQIYCDYNIESGKIYYSGGTGYYNLVGTFKRGDNVYKDYDPGMMGMFSGIHNPTYPQINLNVSLKPGSGEEVFTMYRFKAGLNSFSFPFVPNSNKVNEELTYIKETYATDHFTFTNQPILVPSITNEKLYYQDNQGDIKLYDTTTPDSSILANGSGYYYQNDSGAERIIIAKGKARAEDISLNLVAPNQPNDPANQPIPLPAQGYNIFGNPLNQNISIKDVKVIDTDKVYSLSGAVQSGIIDKNLFELDQSPNADPIDLSLGNFINFSPGRLFQLRSLKPGLKLSFGQTYSGNIFDSTSHQPLAGVKLTFTDSINSPIVTTDASGHFQLFSQTPHHNLALYRTIYE